MLYEPSKHVFAKYKMQCVTFIFDKIGESGPKAFKTGLHILPSKEGNKNSCPTVPAIVKGIR